LLRRNLAPMDIRLKDRRGRAVRCADRPVESVVVASVHLGIHPEHVVADNVVLRWSPSGIARGCN